LVSEVLGVGSSATASSRFRLPCPNRFAAVLADMLRDEWSPSRACGVGSMSASGVPGNGEDEDTAPLVGCTGVRCSYATPFRIEPEVGQVGEGSAQLSERSDGCDVFQEHDPWS
jgi:hypothetical protein